VALKAERVHDQAPLGMSCKRFSRRYGNSKARATEYKAQAGRSAAPLLVSRIVDGLLGEIFVDLGYDALPLVTSTSTRAQRTAH
jgi:hypothetical protein